jgi:hypothetical protein
MMLISKASDRNRDIGIGEKYMSVPGLEAGLHVFFALLSALTASLIIGLLYTNSPKHGLIRQLSILFAILVWLSWISVAPVYTEEYGVDKAVIKEFPETKPAHSIGMETKEHIFYTGLILATLVPIQAYALDLNLPSSRKIIMGTLVTLIIGFIIMDAFGAWISIAAKKAWSIKAGAA